MKKIRVVICGFSQVGRNIFNRLAREKDMQIVGVVDNDCAIAGVDSGVIAAGKPNGMTVVASVKDLGGIAADVAVVATVSELKNVAETIIELLAQRMNVISTCEELFFPLDAHIAGELDQIARQYDVAVTGCGINPGFLMDYLPAVLSGCSAEVDKIEVYRVQNAASRRIQFQRKIGAGQSLENFENLKLSGAIRHVGLPESIGFIATALGWKLDEVLESIVPVVATSDYPLPNGISVEAGQVRGVRQTAVGKIKGKVKIKLEFVAAIGEPEAFDKIRICGEPVIENTILGGVNGDVATVAVIANTVRSMAGCSRAGLLTMLDLPKIVARGV